MGTNNAGALAHIDDDSLLSRIEGGENPARIAQSLGVHKSAIYHRFADKPEYKSARENGMQVRVEDAEDKIESADDPFTLSRAREMFRAVTWRAEHEFPNRWGKAGITINVAQIGLDAASVGSIGALLERVAGQQTVIIPHKTAIIEDKP